MSKAGWFTLALKSEHRQSIDYMSPGMLIVVVRCMYQQRIYHKMSSQLQDGR
jgi:hypothetical protein